MSARNKGLRRAGVVGLSTVVATSMMLGLAVASQTFSFGRLQGIDRYATSVATATSYGASANVILASGVPGHFPDALTASYLAGVKNAPIMLTRLDATPTNVLARIAASGATDVWLVGGTGVISAAQADALTALGYTVHRLGGGDRYLTAQQVINEGGAATSTTAIVTTGINFPDALGAGPLSYVKGMPIGITGTSTLPAATLTALKDAGVTSAIVLGGPTVVTPSVVAALTAGGITPFVGAGVIGGRIFGGDRAETSSKLADYMITNQGFSNTAVNVGSGYTAGGGADALGAAALSGKENRPTLITNSATVVGAGVTAFLTAHANTLTTGHIFGGTGAVSAVAEASMQAAARMVTDTVPPGAPVITTPSGPVIVKAATYTFVGTAEPGSTVTLTGGSAVVSGTATAGAFSIAVPLTQNAVNAITATATDAAGNVSAASTARVVTQDSIAPTVSSVTGAPANLAGVGTHTFTVNFSEPTQLAVGTTPAQAAELFGYKAIALVAPVPGSAMVIAGDGLSAALTFTTVEVVASATDELAYTPAGGKNLQDAAGNSIAPFTGKITTNL